MFVKYLFRDNFFVIFVVCQDCLCISKRLIHRMVFSLCYNVFFILFKVLSTGKTFFRNIDKYLKKRKFVICVLCNLVNLPDHIPHILRIYHNGSNNLTGLCLYREFLSTQEACRAAEPKINQHISNFSKPFQICSVYSQTCVAITLLLLHKYIHLRHSLREFNNTNARNLLIDSVIFQTPMINGDIIHN